jgi:hypothetical protein
MASDREVWSSGEYEDINSLIERLSERIDFLESYHEDELGKDRQTLKEIRSALLKLDKLNEKYGLVDYHTGKRIY